MGRTLEIQYKLHGKERIKHLALVNPEAASDQIDTMEFKFTKNTKVLDIYARDETYLKLIEQKIYKFIQNDSEFDADTEEEHDFLVRKHIRENQLFAICPYAECIASINKYFNNMIPASHILEYPNHACKSIVLHSLSYMGDYLRDWKRTSYRADNVKENEFIQATLNPNTLGMGFDIVVGFLPENDKYISYMYHSYMLCVGRASLIVPTTWMDGRSGRYSKSYKDEVVKHIREVVYFPDSRDITDTDVYGGLSMVFLNDVGGFGKSNKYPYESGKVWVRSYSYKHEHLRHDYNKYYSLNSLKDLNPMLNKLANRIEKQQMNLIDVAELDDVHFSRVAIKDRFGTGALYNEDGRLNGVGTALVLKPGEECPSHYKTVCICNSYDEAKSLSSYFNTITVQYLLAISAVSDNVTDKRNWRHIPMPDRLDHVFNDKEVRKWLGLTQSKLLIERTMEV